MTIKGLDFSAYYLYNAIWVDVLDLTEPLTLKVNVQGREYSFEMTPFQGVVRFNLASIILGLVKEVEDKKSISLTGSNWVVDGAYRVDINLNGTVLQKTFVLGGVNDNRNNVNVLSNLSISDNKWSNFPAYNFKLVDAQLVGTVINEANRTQRVDCDNVYLLFRTRKGAFEGYLFEDYDIEEKSKSLGYYLTDKGFIDSGNETQKRLNVRTKLLRQDYELMQSLIDSKEIYMYSIGDKLTRLSGGNSINLNPKNHVQDFNASFDIPTNYSMQW